MPLELGEKCKVILSCKGDGIPTSGVSCKNKICKTSNYELATKVLYEEHKNSLKKKPSKIKSLKEKIW